MKHTVQLKVGVATHLSWAVVREGGAAAGQAAPAAEVLQLTEGDRVSIACVAAPGYPVMQFGLVPQIDLSVKLYNHGEGPY